MSRKRHKVDRDETAAREYKDARSYVTLFGSEFLFGADMSERRRQVFEIYNGQCRECYKVFEWESEYWDMDHIKSRGKGGADNLTNLQILCRSCHREKHIKPQFTKHAEKVA